MNVIIFHVLAPFSKQWRTFRVKRGIAADAYALKLRDFGITYYTEAAS